MEGAVFLLAEFLVPGKGLEPSRPKPRGPKPRVYTNFTTPARDCSPHKVAHIFFAVHTSYTVVL